MTPEMASLTLERVANTLYGVFATVKCRPNSRIAPLRASKGPNWFKPVVCPLAMASWIPWGVSRAGHGGNIHPLTNLQHLDMRLFVLIVACRLRFKREAERFRAPKRT